MFDGDNTPEGWARFAVEAIAYAVVFSLGSGLGLYIGLS